MGPIARWEQMLIQVRRDGMKRIFYDWYVVGAGCAMQFVESMLFLQSFGAYFAVLHDDRGWSKTELSGAVAMHQA